MRSDWMHVVSAHSHAISWTLLMTSSASRASARRSLSIRNIAWFRAARTSRSCCCTSSADIGLPSVVRGGDVLLAPALRRFTQRRHKSGRPLLLLRTVPRSSLADVLICSQLLTRTTLVPHTPVLDPERHGPGGLAFHDPVPPPPRFSSAEGESVEPRDGLCGRADPIDPGSIGGAGAAPSVPFSGTASRAGAQEELPGAPPPPAERSPDVGRRAG